MLWMKAWLGVRWRRLFALALVLAPLGGSYFNGAPSPEAAGRMMSGSAIVAYQCRALSRGGH
jgi:hypothetical protein